MQILKKLTAFAVIFTLCTAVIPVVSFAEEALPEKWEKPENVTITDKSNTELNYLYNFTLKVSYDKGDDLVNFLSLSESQIKNRKTLLKISSAIAGILAAVVIAFGLLTILVANSM